MNAIEWLKHIFHENSDREFLRDIVNKQSLTFEQLRCSGRAVAADLAKRGLNKGDRIVLFLNNSATYARLYFGCLFSGVVTVPINPVLGESEINYLVKHSKGKLLVVDPQTASKIDTSTIKGAGLEILGIHGEYSHEERIKPWDVENLTDNPSFEPFAAVTPEDTMTLVFTSGTTATPKGVVHSISDLVDNARHFNARLGIGPENRFYGILAMSYLGGYYNLLILPFVAGSSVVLSNAFDARAAVNMWKPAIENGVNTLWLVPTIMSILMQMDRGNKGPEFCRSNIKLALVGTAPLPVSLKTDFEERYGIVLHENYGLSETLFISTNAPTLPMVEGCVGRLVPGVEVTVLNSKNTAVSYDSEGELNVRTPFLMTGIYNPKSGTIQKYDQSEWFPTGDMGKLTATGDLYITGRKKDLIIRGGINISPAAIEEVLHQHPAVIECAVVGLPHKLYGEDIAAVVRLKEENDFASIKQELLATCKTSLASIKQPSNIYELEKFPYSSSGKIQKKKIRELLINKLGLETAKKTASAAPQSSSSPEPLVNGRIHTRIDRCPQDIVQELAHFEPSIVSDCMNRLGTMHSNIHSLSPGSRFCGTAVTVEEVEAGNLMSHAALELLTPGDVLVIDAKGAQTRSCWGGLQTVMAKMRGAVAVVVNGCIRDSLEIRELGLPVFALGTSPGALGGLLKGWGGNINSPIACGGVVVNPGDVVLGDDDGVVVVPRQMAPELMPHCRRRSEMEQEWFRRVEDGEATLDIVNLREKVETFVKYCD